MDRSRPRKASQADSAKKGPRKSTGGTKASSEAQESGEGNTQDKLIRTTVMLPRVLDENWEAYALREGLQKNEVLIKALTEFLIEKDIQPHKKPRIDITYP